MLKQIFLIFIVWFKVDQSTPKSVGKFLYRSVSSKNKMLTSAAVDSSRKLLEASQWKMVFVFWFSQLNFEFARVLEFAPFSRKFGNVRQKASEEALNHRITWSELNTPSTLIARTLRDHTHDRCSRNNHKLWAFSNSGNFSLNGSGLPRVRVLLGEAHFIKRSTPRDPLRKTRSTHCKMHTGWGWAQTEEARKLSVWIFLTLGFNWRF